MNQIFNADEIIKLLDWWLRTGLLHGLGFVVLACIMLIFLWLLAFGAKELVGILRAIRVWIPQVATAHLGFLGTQTAATEKITEAVETLANTHAISGDNHDRTHRTIGRILTAAQAAAEHAGMTQVVLLLKEAKEELERP